MAMHVCSLCVYYDLYELSSINGEVSSVNIRLYGTLYLGLNLLHFEAVFLVMSDPFMNELWVT